jgi:hypothetical protein
MLVAEAFGLICCKPWGDCQPFDYLVYCKRSRRAYRLQVKSCTQRIRGRGFAVSTKRSLGRAYSARHIDFVAAYLAPEDAWYIIPIHALAGRKSIYLYPRNPHSRAMFNKYREAWQLLRK